MGMSKEAFKALVVSLHVKTGLCPTQHVSAAEQLAIFLQMAWTGMGNREQQEWFQRSREKISKPKNAKELFNLLHAHLYNAIEQIFGLVKCRFGILQAAPEYNLGTQACIPVACTALHNFIQLHDPKDPELSLPEDDLTISFHMSVDGMALSSPDPHSQGAYMLPEEKERAKAFCDNLAQHMWEHYVANNSPE
uniref:DUF8040 domain-containing protein n=1 Tax=Moniliophthora roreri TaxID=221103 RepID=A0A0W0FLU1_MONRR